MRAWLAAQLDGCTGHIIETLTLIEVLRTLRELETSGEIDASWAQHVQGQATGWPFRREGVTAARRQRLWELRTRFSLEVATYIAITESLEAEHLEEVALCTADPFLAAAPLPCAKLVVPGDLGA